MHDYVFPVPQSKCYKAREMALEIIEGKHKSQYSRLYDHLAELRLSNPGITIGYDHEHILAVVGIDANDCIYPIAYTVVDSENNSSWSWFLELLAEDLRLTNSYHVPFMTNKQKFTGKALKDALWKATRATYMREYEFILEARDKPIITLLKIIRTKIMQRIAKKKVEDDNWTTTLCPKIQQKLVASIERSNRCWTTHVGHFKYQVACGPHTQHAVDVEMHTFSFRMWQLTGIPATMLFQQYFPLIGYLMNSWTNVTKHPHNKQYITIWFNLLEVKRPFGGIRNEAAARGNSPNQHPESNQRASTQPPSINVVRWYMNTGGSSLSQPPPTIAASSELPRNDQ
ncbi:hypothetical protein V6N13_005921 [Hibiscus sabdariffa]